MVAIYKPPVRIRPAVLTLLFHPT